jgi:amino acid transporter
VVPVSYHDFFAGCATISGALIGLLFVAISVSPEKLAGDRASTEHQVRAGAAFSALVNTLVVALVALLPGAGLGLAGIILGSGGLSTSAGLIVLLYREHRERIQLGQIVMLVLLIALYCLELTCAIQLKLSPRNANAVNNLGTLAILFFVFAIARAWQLVGARDTGLLSAVTELAERQAGHAPLSGRGQRREQEQSGPASGQGGPGG